MGPQSGRKRGGAAVPAVEMQKGRPSHSERPVPRTDRCQGLSAGWWLREADGWGNHDIPTGKLAKNSQAQVWNF